MKSLKNLDKDKMYYVQDNRTHVCGVVLWWGLNNKGYFTDLSQARKYTYDEIQKLDLQDSDTIWESEHVEAHIKHYVDIQELNKKKSL